MADKPENWAELTPEQKRAWRLENFRTSGENIQFVSKEAEKNYNIRAQRFVDVYNLEKPDRVPLNINAGNLPLYLEGLEPYCNFYEPEKSYAATKKFNEKYSDELELYAYPMGGNGPVLDILDYKMYAWPGHGLPKTYDEWQFVEDEYMTVDEYDDLIRDPSDFWLRKYLPRVFGAFEGFKMFQPLTNITENVHIGQLAPLGMPEVQEMLKKMLAAGEAFQKHSASFMRMGAGLSGAHGFPSMFGGFCKAPFDTLGDTLRGTTNIMKDMFRRPDKVLAALDVITDITIENILSSPGAQTGVMVSYPLHKGADGWMSQAQFEKFYWPSLKKVMDTFINEGLIQYLFAEGGFNSRLDYVDQFPKGTVAWLFDRTEMADAKKKLGKNCCILGNIPASLIVTGDVKDVKDYCRNLIETCGQDGGYIMAPGCNPVNPKMENLRAIVETVNEYGYY